MIASSRQAFVGAGSNLGNRIEMLKGAFDALRARPETTGIVSSSIFETLPVGVTAQPFFLNAVFGIETSESPEGLLNTLLEIEQGFGRIRGERWGARTLDLDLLVFEGERRSSDVLQLPHPRMLERGFVTAPLRELLSAPRVQTPRWKELRERLAAAHPDESGCRWAYDGFTPDSPPHAE
jgi:2-amino-4-hydroxy-6-hydroxymethyldihydropteridine diphosphokinase